MKGLPDLARAWAKLRPAGWRVVIAGRDESGHRAEVESELRAGGVEKDFQFVGELDGDSKWATLSSADLLVLPSHSENFGIAVAEALACGVPAIATRGTPWEDLVTHRCGWWCDNGADALAATLRDALARPESELREMGARGRALVETKYSWSGCAAQMLEVYRWMLGQGAKPDCVQ